MTRNSQDDLLIAKNLLTCYIDFLLTRIEQENKILTADFSSLRSLSLPEGCKAYLWFRQQEHMVSANKYSESLLEIKRIISEFYKANQIDLPLYSKEVYHQTLQMHKAEIEQIFHCLLKDTFL